MDKLRMQTANKADEVMRGVRFLIAILETKPGIR